MSDVDDLRTEEDVKIKFLLPFLQSHGYKVECCDFEKAIEVQEGTRRKNIFADVIVYSSKAKTVPLICCETKGPEEVLDRQAREQAISYARLLPKIAPLALLTNGKQVQVFQSLSKNRLEVLPERKSLHSDFLKFVVSDQIRDELREEAKHELFIIDDVQTFKRLLKSCHDEIRNNEGYDPTEAFDELSKVLFCKMHEERRDGSNRFRVSVFDQTLKDLGVNIVQKIFEETAADPRFQGLLEAKEKIKLQDRTLRRIVQLFESTDLSLTAFDVKGEAFEYFLSDTFTGGLGQYFTPRNVVHFITEAIDLKIGEKIIDPFCGTGGFLINAFDVVSEKIRFQNFAESEKEKWRLRLSNESLYGTDWAERTSQTCKMNMVVHGDGSAGIVRHHGLVDIPGLIEPDSFDVCITNPPFGSIESDPEILKKYELTNKKKRLDRVVLALERAVNLVHANGRIGIVVIDGVLNNSSTQYVRDYLRRRTRIKGIISLTPTTFEGYGGRSATSVLLLEKKAEPDDGAQDPCFMAIARNTGYSPTGDPVPGNELPDILLDYQSFLAGKPVGLHSYSWVSEIVERLDAAFYEPLSAPEPSEAAELAGNLTQGFRETLAVAARIEEGISSFIGSEEDYETYKLGDLLSEIRVPERLENDRLYKIIGVKWWGEGVFIREEQNGRDISTGTLYRMTQGRLIYNRLFAAKGSFAMLESEHDGTFASNEFPTFTASPVTFDSDLLLRYIVHSMNSPMSLRVVDARSSGSTRTSRNRFMQNMFLGIEMRVPRSKERLESMVSVMDEAVYVRKNAKAISESAKAMHDAMGTLLPLLGR